MLISKIKADKQGKHLVGHKNYEGDELRSILEHPDPQSWSANEYAGSGVETNGSTPKW